MDYARILTGREQPLPVYKDVVTALENPLAFPDLLGWDLPFPTGKAKL